MPTQVCGEPVGDDPENYEMLVPGRNVYMKKYALRTDITATLNTYSHISARTIVYLRCLRDFYDFLYLTRFLHTHKITQVSASGDSDGAHQPHRDHSGGGVCTEVRPCARHCVLGFTILC